MYTELLRTERTRRLLLACFCMISCTLSAQSEVDAFIIEARALIDAKKFSHAIGILGKAVREDPKRVEARVMRGWAQLGNGNLDGAISDFSGSLKILAGADGARVGLSLAKLLKGDTLGALQELQDITDGEPDAVPALELRSLAYALVGKPEFSLVDAKRVGALDPGRQETRPTDIESLVVPPHTAMSLTSVAMPDRLRSKMLPAYIARARVHMEATDHKSALNDCRLAALMESRSIEPMVLGAEIRVRQGEYAEAILVSRSALKLQPKCAAALALSGLARVHSGDAAKGREEFQEALKFDDKCVWALYGLGILALKDRAYVNAQKQLALVLSVDPKHQDAMDALACCDSVQGDTMKGRKRLDALLAIWPRHSAALNHRSILRAYADDTAGAWSDLQQALALDPTIARYDGPWTYLVNLVVDPESAMFSNQTIIPTESTYARAYLKRGIVRGEMADDKGARCDFTIASRLDPTDYVSIGNRGVANYTLGDYQSAISDSRIALLIEPTYHIAHDILISSLVVTGKLKEATDAVSLFSKVGTDPYGLNNLAWEFVVPEADPKFHHPKLALPLAERAASLSGRKIPFILDTLAACYFKNGDPKKAVAVVEEILRLLDGKDTEHYKLEQANAALRRYQAGLK